MKIPPSDQDAEKAAIGCCITTPVESIPQVGLVITAPDFFYDQRCKTVWELVNKMEAGEVNFVTVNSLLGQLMPKGQAYTFLGECQDAAFSSAHLPVWLEAVKEKFLLRRIIQTAEKAAQEAYESKDPLSSLDAFERSALAIRPKSIEQTDIKSLLHEATNLIEYKAMNGERITGLPTSLIDLDQLSDGLHPGELIVIAALPSRGKTALAVNMAMHNALAGVPIGILSAEMRPVQLVIRSLCSEARVNFRHIHERDCVSLVSQIGRFSKAPIFIQQANGWTISQAQAWARRMSQQYGIKLLVGDYIQRFTGIGENRERQIASIGSGFKDIGMELNIPVIALSQLNDDGRLRESRAIGQDGDSVWILENEGELQSQVQPMTLRIDKSRDGETGKIKLTFLKSFTRFESATREQNSLPYTDD